MKKKIGAFGAGQFSLGTLVEGRPGTTIFQNPGGGEGGGVAYKDPARLPPRGCSSRCSAADCGWQLTRANLRPVINPGATEVLQWQPSYLCCRSRSGCSSHHATVAMQQHFND